MDDIKYQTVTRGSQELLHASMWAGASTHQIINYDLEQLKHRECVLPKGSGCFLSVSCTSKETLQSMITWRLQMVWNDERNTVMSLRKETKSQRDLCSLSWVNVCWNLLCDDASVLQSSKDTVSISISRTGTLPFSFCFVFRNEYKWIELSANVPWPFLSLRERVTQGQSDALCLGRVVQGKRK